MESGAPEYEELEPQRELIAEACRILAARDLSPGFLGHISLRLGPDHLLIRCRGPHERGLHHTTAADIHVVPFNWGETEPPLPGDYFPPNELPLHVEILRARPDVSSVVHAHPYSIVAADLSGIGIQPIIGAYDIPGAKLARAGVSHYPRGVLVSTAHLGREVAHALGDQSVVVLRGHGVATVGASVQEAVLRAISANEIARLSLQIAATGAPIEPLPDGDLDQLPDLGGGLNLQIAWRHELARMESGHYCPRECRLR